MIRQLWTLSIRTRAFLRRYMPTNIALDAIRTRRGLKWGIPAMLVAVPVLAHRLQLSGSVGSTDAQKKAMTDVLSSVALPTEDWSK